MNDGPDWHEDAAFWEAFEAFVFPPGKIDQATEQVDRLCEFLDLDAGSEVLDMPCGVGRHAVELADRGIGVTAVDSTAPFLETARKRADRRDVAIEFVRADMREFEREESFDAACNLYTSFGYFDDRADDERTARNFYASLRPGGRLLMSLASKETLAGRFRKRTWDERDGAFMLEEHGITENWSRIENRWVLADEGGIREFSVSHRLYSAFELTELLRDVGFDEVEAYGDFEGSDFDENAERLVVLAHKG
jgi:SAM-dependent methyltransferase